VLAAVSAAVVAVGAGVYFVVTGSSSANDGTSSEATGVESTAGELEPGANSAVAIDPSRVGPLQPVSVTATCQAPPGVDSVGNTITYEPELTLDAVGATAWRCPGSATGHRLVYDFGAPVTIASLALVPGYAKVDPVDGTDRFAENRTVTAVVWWFDDGTSHRQTIASPGPSPAEADLSAGVVTSQVVLEIADTGNDGATRDFTAISDVSFTGY
jgi:hypothetical protein